MDRVKFKVNGVGFTVGCEVTSDTTLLDYIRNVLELRGTKYMCLEGGCGACIVSASKYPGSPMEAVNTCLVTVTSCEGWYIRTIEGLGNRLKGYHPLQKSLAEKNGSQCGYCSPGWVMSMYSLLQSNKNVTMREIERSLSGNICRCTGYSPILEAFKQYASDYPKPNLVDIEDLKLCDKANEKSDEEWDLVDENDVKPVLHIKLKDGKDWYRVNDTNEMFHILKERKKSYMLVAGNTGKGLYPIDQYPNLLIDISGLTELKGYLIDQNLEIGAGNTLREVIEIFKIVMDTEYFNYLKVFIDHLRLVANDAVRNLATIGGNLFLKHEHPEFVSDIFLLLDTVGAYITILSDFGVTRIVSTSNFLREDLNGKIILNVLLPPLSNKYKLVTYKKMPRAQNVTAIVHSGFLYKLKPDNTVEASRIFIGGLSIQFSRAFKTEQFLIGKKLFINETLQSALKVLNNELVVTEKPPQKSAKYRRQLALGLFYKGLLYLCPKNILNQRYSSGAINIHESRPVSTSQQYFETDSTVWPLNQPMPKVDSLVQCAGEAKYSDDLPTQPDEVYTAFVSAKALGTIEAIDPSAALKEPGVVAFYTVQDLPGQNSFTVLDALTTAYEEILCSGKVQYYDQAVGIIVAIDDHIANRAARLVKIKYSDIKQATTDIRIAKTKPERVTFFTQTAATENGDNVTKIIKDEVTLFGQYHFSLETLRCVSLISEEGLKVYASTHYCDGVQLVTSRLLNIIQSSIDVIVRRLGGSYGIKVSRTALVAGSCNLVAKKLNRPCRFLQRLRPTMRIIGKRLPSNVNYEVGVNDKGVIQYVNYNLYEDNGYIISELLISLAGDMYYNCYKRERWNFTSYNVVTDTASNTWMRSPGSLEAVATAEYMMERISYELSLDPVEVRLANLDIDRFVDVKEMYEKLKKDSQYLKRKADVEKYNKENRWKKRGLRFAFMKWVTPSGAYYGVNLSVYHHDGSIAILHGGVEMGQGINTKAIQICAYFLNVPVDKIIVKPNDTTSAPNCITTGASTTTQYIGIGVRRCCEELLKRLEPIRNRLNNPTWEELIAEAYSSSVDLFVRGFVNESDVMNFNVYAVCLAEVLIDVITGEMEILRIDLFEDAGRSVNPEIDIGQIQGAFVMGVGYMTIEELVYDKITGELLTDHTVNYWVPQALDIAQDFRIYLRKRSYSDEIILGAKVTGEPGICMGVAVPLAMRAAIVSARLESGIPSTKWFDIEGPYTVEKVCLAAETKIEDFKFY